MRTDCFACGAVLDGPTLDFIDQPLSNRFLSHAGPGERTNFRIAACAQCAMVQAVEHPPATTIRPMVPWLKYNERESHLDAFVRAFAQSGAVKGGTALGLGPFDEVLLKRLAPLDFTISTRNLLLEAQATHVGSGFPYLETAEATIRACEPFADPVDLIACRFVPEHSPDPKALLTNLRRMVKPGGTLIIEIPDSEKFLRRLDYAHLWEEHLCYFTEATLRRFVAYAGFELTLFFRSPDLYEDSLIAVLRPATNAVATIGAPQPEELAVFAEFTTAFAAFRRQYREFLSDCRTRGQKTALVGIGHHATFLLHAFGLTSAVDYLVDDNANKRGLYIPDALNPIVPSATLLAAANVAYCWLCTSPQAETPVLATLAPLRLSGTTIGTLYEGGQLPSMRDLLAQTRPV